MATIQQSVEIHVPVHTLYEILNHFEDYPQFMDNVENVEQVNDSFLHWTTKMANRPVEWDASITKQVTDRCIAWSDLSGISGDCRIEVESLGERSSRAVFTMHAEPGQFPGVVAGDTTEDMQSQLNEAMAKLKNLVEGRLPPQTGTTRVSGAASSGSSTEVLEDKPDEAKPRNYR